MSSIVNDLRDEAQIVWSLCSDGQKAAIRTAYQNVQAAAVIALFAVASSVVAWASGADIDILGVVATGRAAIGAAVITSLASLKSYYMNRGSKGARYR